jgi:hypothetical protein
MPDYSLGRAHGKIEIDYDGGGADRAAHDLDKVAKSSAEADTSLSKTGKTVQETGREFESSGSKAQGYSAKLRDVRQASEDVKRAESEHTAVLRNSKASLEDVERAHGRVADAKRRHASATHALRDSHGDLTSSLAASGRVLGSLTQTLEQSFGHLGKAQSELTQTSGGLTKALGTVGKAVSLLGPEGKAAGAGLAIVSKAVGNVGSSANSASSHVRDFIKHIASFEVAFGKVAGMTLAVPAVGGLAGIAGGAGLMGLTEIAGAVKQLSGVLGLLPATISGVLFSVGTLKIAFRGVGDALKDMMADDPKKFLEDIKDMAPAAAQAMLQLAGFRDQFKLAMGVPQQAFFAQILGDIRPLVQTWLPAISSGMSQIATIFGQAAHQLAGLLQQPQMMAAFQQFVANLGEGLKALQPALGPLVHMFTTLTTVGASFFPALGEMAVHAAQFFDNVISKANDSGALKDWINTGIDAFAHLGNILYQVGSAFLNVMNVADKFGGGGLLGFLDDLTNSFAAWTESADGQKSLTDFFSLLRQATDAFLPMLRPLTEGFLSIGKAFLQLGVATSPAWLDLFKTFARVMQENIGPAIVGMGPAVNTFLQNLGAVMVRLSTQIGPQLPRIFEMLANAFVQLLPQLPPLAFMFAELLEQVGPQLPKMFREVTTLIEQLIPVMPQIVEAMRIFVSAVTLVIEAGGKLADVINLNVQYFGKIGDAIGGFLSGVVAFAKSLPQKLGVLGDSIADFFTKLPGQAEQWGKDVLHGFINGLKSVIGDVEDFIKRNITDHIPAAVKKALGIQSPSRVFHDIGVNIMRGMQQGLAAGAPAVVAQMSAITRQVTSAAGGASAAVRGGGGGAAPPSGADSVGGALLPDHIAGANTGVLDAYLNHQFPENRGLKGLAKSLGAMLQVGQTGFNLAYQQVFQPLMQVAQAMTQFGQGGQKWRRLTPQEQFAELQRKAMQGNTKLSWGPITGASVGQDHQQTPLGLTAASTKEDIQRAIIAAGRARGMNDAEIQTALAVSALETGRTFNPTISGGVQGSAGLVSGLFQQSPSSGWGTLDQVNDPNYAINAFYNAFQQQLAKNPGNPMLAAVLTQNPQLGGGAQGSKYWNDLKNQLGYADSILGTLGPDVKNGPTWPMLQGQPGGAVAPPTYADYKAWYGNGGITGNPASRASTLGGANANYTPQTMAAAGIAPLFVKSGSDSMAGAPAWVNQLAAAFGLTATSHADTTLHGGVGQMGDWAFDFSGDVGNMQRFADFIRTNLIGQTLQAIWENPQTGQQLGIAGGQLLGRGQYYTTAGGSYGDHRNHVHWATDVPVLIDGQLPPGSMLQPGAPTTGGDIPLANGQTVNQTLNQNLSVSQQLLDAYLQGNPALADQINAAKTPGATDQQVLSALQGIDTATNQLKAQDAVGNQNTISALQSAQQQLATSQGYTNQSSGQNSLQTALSAASTVGSGAANLITGGFQIASSVLDAMAATQDVADRFVYGMRNTQDVGKVIDDFQKYITLAANIATEVGNGLQFAGSIVSMFGQAGSAAPTGGFGDPGAAVAAVGQGLQFGAMIAQVVSGVLQGINATIDYAQMVSNIVGGYVGRLLSNLTAGPFGGTPLMGNVRFLYNTNANQLVAYSRDNPQNQNTLPGSSFLGGLWGMGGGNQNPQTNNQFIIYGGPGQSAGQLLNASMWMVANSGAAGAGAAANF